jgi:DNA invertase Pin-like site-specific DNA recombinase
MKHPTDSRRAVIYARYSSHNQRDVSIDQQVKACRKFAERQDIEIVRIYDDRATTGTNDRRPGFQQMIKDAAKGNWDYVIVYTLDRFSRNRYDSAVNKRTLKTYGIKVLSAMENISDDPTGVLMESMLEGLAEYYSAELSRKIKRGMDDNASKCLCTGHFPYGYVRGADDRYAIDESEAEVVREIFQKVRDGVRICDRRQAVADQRVLRPVENIDLDQSAVIQNGQRHGSQIKGGDDNDHADSRQSGGCQLQTVDQRG